MIDAQQAAQAINHYFNREAAEMYCILGGSACLLFCALLLWLFFNDRFSSALAITLSVVALLYSAVAVSLLIRDGANRSYLIETVQSGEPQQQREALTAERERMQAVADNYQNLRYLFSGLALMGALLIAFTHHSISHAVAVGLLVFALSGTVIDRYSEARATLYLGALKTQTS